MVEAQIYTKGKMVKLDGLLISEDGTLYQEGYSVSNRSGSRVIKGKFLSTRKRNSRVDYLEFSFKSKKYLLHRVLASTFKDRPAGCNIARHLDDNHHNNNLDNLEWGTSGDNTNDGIMNGCYPTGIGNKLSLVVDVYDSSSNYLYSMCGKKEIQSKGFWQANVHKACKTGLPYKGLYFRVREE